MGSISMFESHNTNDILSNYKKYLEAEEKEKKGEEDNEEQANFNNKPKNYKEVKIIGSKSTTVYILIIIFICCIVLSLYFGINIIINFNSNESNSISLSYLDFHQNRGYFILSSILYYKLYISTNNDFYMSTYKNFLTEATLNEQNIQVFLLNGKYKDFDENIFNIDSGSLCDYFIDLVKTNTFNLSNNITVFSESNCKKSPKLEPITNKGLTQINLYIINYLRDKFNLFYMYLFENKKLDYNSFYYNELINFIENDELKRILENKPNIKDPLYSNLVYFLNQNNFEAIEILSQFAIRQATFEINSSIFNKIFKESISNIRISYIYSAIFIVQGIIILIGSRYLSSNMIFIKKKRNDLLIKILPYQFIENEMNNEIKSVEKL